MSYLMQSSLKKHLRSVFGSDPSPVAARTHSPELAAKVDAMLKEARELTQQRERDGASGYRDRLFRET